MRVDKTPDDPNAPRPGFRPGKDPKVETQKVSEQPSVPNPTVDEEAKKKAEAEALQSEVERLHLLESRLQQLKTQINQEETFGK